MILGHFNGDYVHDHQPAKFAAIEARWKTEQPASEVLNLKAIAGDFDIQNRHIDVNKLPVFSENQQRGGYRVELNKSAVSGGSSTGIAFNQDWNGDPELASFIRNADFRRAVQRLISSSIAWLIVLSFKR